MDNRYLGAILISPLLIFIFLGGGYLHFLAMVLSLVGMHEFFKVVKGKNFKPMKYIGYISCIIYYLILYKSGDISTVLPILILLALILLCIPVIDVKYNFVDSSITFLAFIYIGIFFSLMPLIDRKPHGEYLIWLLFIASWSTDTVAYYIGKNFGTKKLCEKVSPKKTIEGSLGGLLGSTAVCGIYGIIVCQYVNIIPVYHFFIIGALCGVLCQFGDLVASSIKRFVGVKDYSNLIPGHGGILDRFDSILFASVVVYYYISLVIGI